VSDSCIQSKVEQVYHKALKATAIRVALLAINRNSSSLQEISTFAMDEIQANEKRAQLEQHQESDYDIGKMTTINDLEVENFYGSSTTQSYRLKSELVGKCMEEIGMGWYGNYVFVNL
jgi:hypothetical protein